jgi:hypothetical protein
LQTPLQLRVVVARQTWQITAVRRFAGFTVPPRASPT